MSDARKKYNELHAIIAERQAFEGQPEHKVVPYINHRTDFNFYDVHGHTLLQYACMLGDMQAVTVLVDAGAELARIFHQGRSNLISCFA